MKKILWFLCIAVLVCGVLIAGCAQPAPQTSPSTPAPVPTAPAQSVITLKAMSFSPVNVEEALAFVEYIKMLETNAAGKLKINFLGGPEVIPAVEQVEALRKGVMDLALSVCTYHDKIVPESAAYFLIPNTKPSQERENGLHDILVAAYEKANIRLLSRNAPHQGFNVWTTFPVTDPRTDFKGKKIRLLPTYDSFLKAIGAVGVVVPRVDVYTAMERGVIQGQLGPPHMVVQQGQIDVTKYYISPMLYAGSNVFYMNLDSYKKLSKDMQDVFNNTAIEFEKKFWPYLSEINEKNYALCKAGGIKEIKFSPEDTKWYVDMSQIGEWEELLKVSPEVGQKLKKIAGY